MATDNILLTYEQHVALLRELFPQGRVLSMYPQLIWQCHFQPTPLSINYTIRLEYKSNTDPKVFVTKKKLSRGVSGKLPHVYSDKNQWICLHYPPEEKWKGSQNIATTIVPWAIEWLYHYEIWQLTGLWNGGGTIHQD